MNNNKTRWELVKINKEFKVLFDLKLPINIPDRHELIGDISQDINLGDISVSNVLRFESVSIEKLKKAKNMKFFKVKKTMDGWDSIVTLDLDMKKFYKSILQHKELTDKSSEGYLKYSGSIKIKGFQLINNQREVIKGG